MVPSPSSFSRRLSARFAHLIAPVLVSVSLGCGPAGPQPPHAPASDGEPPTHAPAPSRGNSLLNSEILNVLPRSTEAVLVVQSPSALWTKLGLASLRSRHADLLDPLHDESVSTLGVDLLTPQRWPEAGLDPHKPAGAALLDSRGPTGCFFAGLVEAARFEQLLTRRATDLELPLHRDPLGESTLWTTPGDTGAAVLLHGDHVLLVVGPGAREAAQAIARAPSDGSLAHDHDLKTAASSLRGGTDAALYAVGPLLARELRGARADEPTTRHPVVDAVRSVALGATASAGPVELSGFVSVTPQSLPIAVAGRGAPSLRGAPIELTLSLQPKHLGELWRSLLMWEGRPERAQSDLTEMLGVDASRRLLPVMTGATRIAVQGRPAIPPATIAKPKKSYAVTLAAELVSPQAAAELAPELRGTETSRARVEARDRWLSATWLEGPASPLRPPPPPATAERPAFLRAHVDLALLAYLDMPLSYPFEGTTSAPGASVDPVTQRRLDDLAAIEEQLRKAWRRAERIDAEHVLAAYAALGAITFAAVPTEGGFRLQGALHSASGDVPSTVDRLLSIRRDQARALESQLQTIQMLEARRVELLGRLGSGP